MKFILFLAVLLTSPLFAKIAVEDFDSRILDSGKNVTLSSHRKIYVPQNSPVVFKATSKGQIISFDLSEAASKNCAIDIAIYNKKDKKVRHASVNHGQASEMYLLSIDEPVLVVSEMTHRARCTASTDLVVMSAKPLYIGK